MAGRSRSRLGKSYFRNLGDAEKTHFINNYLKGEGDPKPIARKASGEQLQRHAVAVCPFGIVPAAAAAAAGEQYIVSATKQALEIAKTADSNLSVFGLQATPPTGAVSIGGFFPALCVITLISENSPIADNGNKSRFSGKPTPLKATRSGSVPIGRTLTDAKDSDYQERIIEISQGVKTATFSGAKIASISFKPEVFKIESASLENGSRVTAGVPSF